MTEGGDAVGWSSSSRTWGALDIDDVNGYGPENIKTVPGYTGGEYEVKIHYYSDHFNGPTIPTVRVVYVDPTDNTVCDVTASQLMETREWWTVGMFGPGFACPN